MQIENPLIKRPAIGTRVIVHGQTELPFKARVESYYECDENSVLVKRYYTNQEWIVDWRKCELLLNLKIWNYEI